MAGSQQQEAAAPRVGVLALQGDFREHLAVLTALGAVAVPVRRPDELASVSGLVIPGGESTVMDKLSRTFGMAEPLRAAVDAGLPVYGTCAGLIMLADRVVDVALDEGQRVQHRVVHVGRDLGALLLAADRIGARPDRNGIRDALDWTEER